MIAASRRRRPGPANGDETFGLHLRMARRTAWSKRLLRGAIVALCLSFVALLAGLGWQAHLAVVLLALAVGLVLPVAGTVQVALEEIRQAAGLSYETALDIVEDEAAVGSTPAVDPYGLRAAVVDRARLSVRDVKPTAPPAWWLPVLAVALALLLFTLPGTPGGASGAGGVPGADGPPGAGAPVVPEGEQDLLEEEVAPPLEPETGRAQEPPDAGSDGDQSPPEEPRVTPPAEGNDASAPLSRFLDSLRERPQDLSSAEEEQGRAPDPDEQAGQPPQGEQAPGGEPGDTGEEPPRTSTEESGSGGEPNESGAEGEAGEEQSTGEGEGAQDGASEAESGEQEPGGAGEQPEPDAAGEAPAGQAGDQLDEGDSDFQGGSEGGDSENEGGLGAGAGAGEEQAAGVAEGDQAPPELLEGVLESGPENPAGSVRLPGSDDVVLPPGRSLSDYQNAAEDAVSEGDIPLSYQEIIRRYFQ